MSVAEAGASKAKRVSSFMIDCCMENPTERIEMCRDSEYDGLFGRLC